MSGHTAGPWRVVECGVPDCWCAVIESSVSDVEGDNVIINAGSLRKHNAALVAAAPTMLCAIEQFEKWWTEVGQVSFNGAPACVFALCEAAALARGES